MLNITALSQSFFSDFLDPITDSIHSATEIFFNEEQCCDYENSFFHKRGGANELIPSCEDPQCYPAYEVHLYHKLHECSAIKDLLSKVSQVLKKENRRQMQILIVDPPNREAAKNKHAAVTDIANSHIRVQCDSVKPLSMIVFELTNLLHYPRITQVHNKVLSGLINDATTYAHEVEKIEYRGVKISHDVLRQCIKERDWSSSILLFPNKHTLELGWKNFEHYLKDQTAQGHTQQIMKQFENIKKRITTK